MAGRFCIREYANAMVIGGYALPIGREPGFDQPVIPVGGGALPSAPFLASTKLIRVQTDTRCSFVVSTPGPNAVVATVQVAPMEAKQTEYFGVNPGDQLSVIANP